MNSSIDWHGDEVFRRVLDAGWEGIRRATVFFWQLCMQAVNISAGPTRQKRLRNTSGGAKGSSRTVYTNPASITDPPHKRTGFGQANIDYELDQAALRGRVGVRRNAIYMAFLELKGYLWMRGTLDRNFDAIATQVAGK
jgi:hypothetical protein